MCYSVGMEREISDRAHLHPSEEQGPEASAFSPKEKYNRGLRWAIEHMQSRWFKWTVVILWLLNLLVMLERGWVWHSRESSPGGGHEYSENYFDIHQTALFSLLTVVIVAYGVWHLRRYSLAAYGMLRLSLGLVGGYVALASTSGSGWFLAFLVAVVLIILGVQDINEELQFDSGPSQRG